MATSTWTNAALLTELEPVVAQNLDRHLSVAKEWMPHEFVPWADGTNFERLGGKQWSPGDSQVSDVAKTALIVNLLTEDNLPSYHHEIASLFSRDGSWGTWVHRWTAEEGRHAMAIRDYLLTTRAVDPEELERARMTHMGNGYASSHPDEVLHNLAYVTFQELATRVSHRNTGRITGEPICDQLMAKIANDENLHMVFYRNLIKSALEIAPDQTLRAIVDVVQAFAMPGADLPGFQRKSIEMAIAGVYDLRQHHDDVVMPVLRFWKVFEMTGLGPEGQKAQEELVATMGGIDTQAARFEDKKAMLAERMKR
ncbi:acyl-ACP desaturase [Luteipulveratus mongoliensis]|uniref:Acyl-ACP desaturase n=1 Tax=Luteipulveratus mongoliensis TaxID=571913 RepID=A0A0K1JDY0_9MICO|nr:acyl-ACP desaturase [Luteipulveratus mongoliensis]AKU14798.1 acyl-ACP desaturase [Luteipulveratus mongoliensis]